MRLSRLLVLLVVVAVVSVLVVVGAVSYFLNIRSSGNLRVIGLRAFNDSDLTEECTEISWGNLYAGGTSSKTLWIVNNGSVPVTLSCYAENFSPANAVYVLTLSWDYDGGQVDCGGVVAVTLALSVSVEPLGIREFSFDVVIVAVEVSELVH